MRFSLVVGAVLLSFFPVEELRTIEDVGIVEVFPSFVFEVSMLLLVARPETETDEDCIVLDSPFFVLLRTSDDVGRVLLCSFVFED